MHAKIINIYCDESCHLEHDRQQVMTLGAIWCPADKTREIAIRVREIKVAHGLPAHFEIKWTKVSPAKIAFYQAIMDYFFDDADLHFRGVVIPDKTRLNHNQHNQSHDDWYYKMYFYLVTELLNPDARHYVYLDIKDTASAAKTKKLHEVLCSSKYDFNQNIIARVQTVRSDEVEQLQVCDLLMGAVTAANRTTACSPAKQQLIRRIRQRSGLSLNRSTLRGARKLNLLLWNPEERKA